VVKDKKREKTSRADVRKELKEALKRWGWNPSGIIDLLRGGGSPGKGGNYERDTCRLLSRWWTDDARDDIFWRSSASGARAKVRGRAGANTAGQHGDVAATDPIGAPLIDIFTIELKRGYSEYTFQDLVDRKAGAGVQEWERFITQTIESFEQAGSYTWLLITRRDRREALAWMPTHVFKDLKWAGAFADGFPNPFCRMRLPLRYNNNQVLTVDICGMTLEAWLAGVRPEDVKRLEKEV